MNEDEHKRIISEHMSTLGKKGGNTTLKRHGREHFSVIAKARKGTSTTWAWDPKKKGKRKSKDVMDTITPPETSH
jgi:hypothetical protein